MRSCTDDLVEILAREHRTVEGLLEDLAEVDSEAELYGLLQTYSQMTKSALVAALSRSE
jgi:hypothetical protein